MTNEMKRQPVEWEVTSANPISNKGVISRIYKEFIDSIPKTNK